MIKFKLVLVVMVFTLFLVGCSTDKVSSSSEPDNSSVETSNATGSTSQEESSNLETSYESQPSQQESSQESEQSEISEQSTSEESELSDISEVSEVSENSEISEISEASEVSENSEPPLPVETKYPIVSHSEFGLVAESEPVDDEYFDDAIMIGDSITEGIKLYSVMKNTTVISHTGINLSTITTKEVIETDKGKKITIIDALSLYPDTQKVYVMLGVNGMAWMSKTKFTNLYGDLIDKIKEKLPEAIIYVESVFPINEPIFREHYGNQDINNEKIDEYNYALENLCVEKNVYFVNVAESIKDSQNALSASATSDGMHIGKKTYNKWFDYLKSHTVSVG